MRRWIAFCSVGAIGIVIQLLVLAALADGLGMNYLLATILAVEAAILHNFVWHETWTWSDRSRGDRAGMWKRLARFHATNGAISIGGNIILMRFFVGTFALNATIANALAIAFCSILNFLASDRLVFQGAECSKRLCGDQLRLTRQEGPFPLVTDSHLFRPAALQVRTFLNRENVAKRLSTAKSDLKDLATLSLDSGGRPMGLLAVCKNDVRLNEGCAKSAWDQDRESQPRRAIYRRCEGSAREANR